MTTSLQSGCRIDDSRTGLCESLGYLEIEGERLYVAQHHAKGPGAPLGCVVVCGPIAAERERAWRTLTDLSRALAGAGFEVLRFDYRGIGESTGSFEQLCLSDWERDIRRCIAHLRSEFPGSPLALWGVRAGALLAAEIFTEGTGDAAMLVAPMGGRPMLLDILRRNLVVEMISRPGAPRASADECVAKLLEGELVNIDGYFWSRKLWEDADKHPLVVPAEGEGRQWRLIEFKGSPRIELAPGAEANREVEGPERFWESGAPLVPQTGRIIPRTVEWMKSWRGEKNECCAA